MLTQLNFCTGSADAVFCLGTDPGKFLFSCLRIAQLNQFSQAKALTEQVQLFNLRVLLLYTVWDDELRALLAQ